MDKQIQDQDDEQQLEKNTDKTKNKLRVGRKTGLDFRK